MKRNRLIKQQNQMYRVVFLKQQMLENTLWHTYTGGYRGNLVALTCV